jgi:hypothetical protein
MEAAKALSPLEKNESRATPEESIDATYMNTSTESSDSMKSKRFIPDHKKPDAALTFPEKVRNYALYELN